MCSLHSNVIKTPAITHEEKIKEKHKDVTTDASSFLLFYTTGYYCIFYFILQKICEMATLYYSLYIKKNQYTFIIQETQYGTDNTSGRT